MQQAVYYRELYFLLPALSGPGHGGGAEGIAPSPSAAAHAESHGGDRRPIRKQAIRL